MKSILCKSILCIFLFIRVTRSRSVGSFVFPDERQNKKLEPIISPPVLPVLEHLERDPSTLLPGERRSVNPKFGGGFNVKPGNGGLSASVSSSLSGGGLSHSASQSFSFGFNEGFSSSQSASQASSFNGFGNGFSGSQASSQSASFGSSSISGAASSASSLSGGFGSQSASSAFGISGNSFQPEATFGDGLLDVRHRGAPNFPFPSFFGRSKGRLLSAAAFSSRPSIFDGGDDILSILIS